MTLLRRFTVPLMLALASTSSAFALDGIQFTRQNPGTQQTEIVNVVRQIDYFWNQPGRIPDDYNNMLNDLRSHITPSNQVLYGAPGAEIFRTNTNSARIIVIRLFVDRNEGDEWNTGRQEQNRPILNLILRADDLYVQGFVREERVGDTIYRRLVRFAENIQQNPRVVNPVNLEAREIPTAGAALDPTVNLEVPLNYRDLEGVARTTRDAQVLDNFGLTRSIGAFLGNGTPIQDQASATLFLALYFAEAARFYSISDYVTQALRGQNPGRFGPTRVALTNDWQRISDFAQRRLTNPADPQAQSIDIPDPYGIDTNPTDHVTTLQRLALYLAVARINCQINGACTRDP